MKTKIPSPLYLLAVLLFTGCGDTGNIAPMSGKLTIDGQPVEGIEIIFSPKAVADNSNVGPYSFGTTDAEGNYELKTRYGDTGAVVGMHDVIMQYSDLEAGAMDELRDEMMEAKASREGVAEVAAQVDALKNRLKNKVIIPASAAGVFEVPPGGNRNANFDLVN